MSLYRKKPIVIEAFQWTGGPDQKEDPQWIVDAIEAKEVWFGVSTAFENILHIQTLEGTMTARRGDWIIKGVKGEIYPCKPDIFEQTYESVDELPCDEALPTSGLNFGAAIAALKRGQCVARAGWNGKGMYLWLLPAMMVKAEWCREAHLKSLAEANGGEIEALGSIRMMTADRKVLTGWLASQTDMLAEDWQIISD